MLQAPKQKTFWIKFWLLIVLNLYKVVVRFKWVRWLFTVFRMCFISICFCIINTVVMVSRAILTIFEKLTRACFFSKLHSKPYTYIHIIGQGWHSLVIYWNYNPKYFLVTTEIGTERIDFLLLCNIQFTLYSSLNIWIIWQNLQNYSPKWPEIPFQRV
jgi:hypothetical protein